MRPTSDISHDVNQQFSHITVWTIQPETSQSASSLRLQKSHTTIG